MTITYITVDPAPYLGYLYNVTVLHDTPDGMMSTACICNPRSLLTLAREWMPAIVYIRGRIHRIGLSKEDTP